MKNGFTLVEILAVIVVLAALMLITIPVVLNTINKSRSSTSVVSASKYLDSVKIAVSNNLLENITIRDGTYSILDNGNICIGVLENDECSNELEVSAEGSKPNGGSITIFEGEINSVDIKFDKRTIVKNSKGQLVDSADLICFAATEETKTTGNVPKNKFSIGDEYICNVNNEHSYHFFVVVTDKKNVNLILDRNVNINGTLVTKAAKHRYATVYNLIAWTLVKDYVAAGGTEEEYGTYGNNSKGPLTAMKFLEEATSSWTNIPIIDEIYEDENISVTTGVKGTNGYGKFKIKSNSRLPKVSEVYGEGKCTNELGSCPLWIVNYMESNANVTGEGLSNISGISGYWTMSSTTAGERYVVSVVNDGRINDSGLYNTANRGIRPVIEVPKESFSL